MTQTPAGQPGEAKMDLAVCAFCGIPLTVRHTINPSGQCETEGCWMKSRAISVPTDDPRQVAEWNTRATPPGAAGQAVSGEDRAALKHARSRLSACKVAMPSSSSSWTATIREMEAALDVADQLIARHAAPLPGYAAGLEAAAKWHDKWANSQTDTADTLIKNGDVSAAGKHRDWARSHRAHASAIRSLSPLPEQAAVEKMARAIYEASPSSRKQNGGLRLTWEKMLLQFPEACEMWRTIARAAYAALHGEG